MTVMMTRAEFAASRDVSERTVSRWIREGQLPEAKMVRGQLQIPEDATRVLPPEGAPRLETGALVTSATRPGHASAVTLSDALELQPAYLAVDVAAPLLGVPESMIRRHPDEFGAVRRGARGALVVPQRVVREAAGL